MNIEELLEQYFEGQTSVEEEATIRRFFASGDVPENLEMYKPLFAYIDDEISASEFTHPASAKKPAQTGKKFVLWLSGAAACAAILVGTFLTNRQLDKCPMEGDYVIINGRCYTDAKTIRSATLNTLREISGNDSEHEEGDTSGGVKQIIENQLKEFGSFFDE